MSKRTLKGFAVIGILLCIGLAVAPSVNANVVRESFREKLSSTIESQVVDNMVSMFSSVKSSGCSFRGVDIDTLGPMFWVDLIEFILMLIYLPFFVVIQVVTLILQGELLSTIQKTIEFIGLGIVILIYVIFSYFFYFFVINPQDTLLSCSVTSLRENQ